jgi:membrane protease YdiL (CAAX protease family)
MISTIDRSRIYIFVAIAYAVSIALAVVIYLNGGLFLEYPKVTSPFANTMLTLLMFAPALANVVTRLVTREGWSNMLLRPNFRRGWPFYLAALFLPALAILVGGAIYYVLFPDQFDPSMKYALETFGMRPIGPPMPPLPYVLLQTAYVIPASLMALPLMFGEEFGWRAYLQQKLMPLGPRKALLLLGVIWTVWHWPAIALGYEYGFGYWGAPVVGPLLFLWYVVPLAVVFGWLTIRSGSVWPAAVAHGVNNASALLMMLFAREPLQRLIGPLPVGIVGALGMVALALLIFFMPGALAPSGNPKVLEQRASE